MTALIAGTDEVVCVESKFERKCDHTEEIFYLFLDYGNGESKICQG